MSSKIVNPVLTLIVLFSSLSGFAQQYQLQPGEVASLTFPSLLDVKHLEGQTIISRIDANEDNILQLNQNNVACKLDLQYFKGNPDQVLKTGASYKVERSYPAYRKESLAEFMASAPMKGQSASATLELRDSNNHTFELNCFSNVGKRDSYELLIRNFKQQLNQLFYKP